MKQLILGAGFIFCLLMQAPRAHANDLFYDSCAVGIKSATTLSVHLSSQGPYVAAGLTCKDVKKFTEAAKIIKLALMPAVVALASPGVREIVLPEFTALGLTLANPVVLGVTVLGAAGLGTFYIIMNKTMEQCDRMDQAKFRQAVVNELERKYAVSAAPGIMLEKKR